MAKKNFDLGSTNPKPDEQHGKAVTKTKLSLLSDKKEGPADIMDVNMDFNSQMIDIFIELFGPKWKYRTIIEAQKIAGVTIRQGQLKQFEQGKSFHQQNLLALLMVIAHHKGSIISFKFDDRVIDIITNTK